jgi:hypothetical protein
MNFGENVVVHFFPTTGISTNCYFTIFEFLADFFEFWRIFSNFGRLLLHNIQIFGGFYSNQ